MALPLFTDSSCLSPHLWHELGIFFLHPIDHASLPGLADVDANFKSDPPRRARIVGNPHICLCIRTRPAKLSWYKSRTMPVSLPKIRRFQRIKFVSFKTAVILQFQTSSSIVIIHTFLNFEGLKNNFICLNL